MPIDVSRSRYACKDRAGAGCASKAEGNPVGDFPGFGKYGRLCIAAAADLASSFKSSGGA